MFSNNSQTEWRQSDLGLSSDDVSSQVAELARAGVPPVEGEISFIKGLEGFHPDVPDEGAFRYLALRGNERDPERVTLLQEVFHSALNAISQLSEAERDAFDKGGRATNKILISLLKQKLVAEIPFWENCYVSANPNVSRHSNSPVVASSDPRTQKEFVTKLENIGLENEYVDPRKVALFQEAARYYGVRTVPEITALPTPALFTARRFEMLLENLNCNDRSIGYSDFLARSQSDYNNRHRRGIRIAQRAPVAEWFSDDLFDDSYTITATGETNFGTVSVDEIRRVPRLNQAKFTRWYEGLDATQRKKNHDSIAAVHAMVGDGFLFDLFGGCNFTFKDGEFLLIDVEPLQLSALPQGTRCVSYTVDLLNFLFRTVGLSEINYDAIVKKHYGEEKFIQREHEEGARLTANHTVVAPGEWWYSNVTNSEELGLYRRQLDEQKSEKGDLPPPPDFPPELQQRYAELLTLPDDYFAGMRFDWTAHYSASDQRSRYLMGS